VGGVGQMEDEFDKREMSDSDFDFYPGNWKSIGLYPFLLLESSKSTF